MGKTRFVLIFLISVYFFNCSVLGQTERSDFNSSSVKTTGEVKFIRTVTFYLRDNKLISGRLVSEDKSQFTVEEMVNGELVVRSYARREIDTRSIRTKGIQEYKYYIDIGDQFAAQTWDFRNDPDEFIHAIRAYEKARHLLEKAGERGEDVKEVEAKLESLRSDREIWIKEVESRVKLKKLEFEATVENRLSELEKITQKTNEQLVSSLKAVDKIVTDLSNRNEQVETGLSKMSANVNRQMKTLAEQIAYNRDLIDYIDGTYYYHYYRQPSPRKK
jgi:hypothetical protein